MTNPVLIGCTKLQIIREVNFFFQFPEIKANNLQSCTTWPGGYIKLQKPSMTFKKIFDLYFFPALLRYDWQITLCKFYGT